MAELTLEQPITGAPPQVPATIVLNFVKNDVVNDRLDCVLAFTFHGAQARVWQLREIEPVDDVVRSLAKREEAEAVVVVGPGAVPPGAEGDRCCVIAAECGAGKFDALILMKSGPAGGMFQFGSRTFDGAAKFQWFGIPPVGKVDLWIEGIVGRMPFGPPRGDTGGSA
jgi:hypothetical protein